MRTHAGATFGLMFCAIMAATAIAPVANAQTPKLTSTQILDFFLKDKAAAEAAKAAGKTRALCIGTAAECPADGAQSIARFDLLVNFDYNSADLTKTAKDNLDQFSLALKDPKLAGTKFEIDGHTDASGGEEYNQGLSERRAQSVVAYLAAQGIDASTLIAKGFGKTKPRVADPMSPENRRVETHLLD
jgi:outer membrane protein OmpA-like peptidoglycan-associated protein